MPVKKKNLASGGGFLLCDSACPQSFSTVRDAGFEPEITASVFWIATVTTTSPSHVEGKRMCARITLLYNNKLNLIK